MDEELNEVDWHRISKELILFLARKARAMGHNPASFRLEISDIAAESIAKVILRFDLKRGNLKGFLFHVAANDLRNEIKSAAHRREKRDPEADGVTVSTETTVIAAEESRMRDQRLRTLLTLAESDPPLKLILEAILKGGCQPKPKALAAATDLPVPQIYNITKRLRRLTARVR